MNITFVLKLKGTERVGSTNMLEHDDAEHDESSDLAPYVAKMMKLVEDETEIVVEIEHFSYAHELKLTDELDINKQCDECL